MKITIDTKEDSHSEIRKIISMLQALVGGTEEVYSNRDIFSEPGPEVTPSTSEPSGGVFGNLFSDDEKTVAEETETADTEETSEEPDSDENVEVVPY